MGRRQSTYTYIPHAHYTQEELDKSALRDLELDAESSEQQAERGPFYPEKGITRESLLAYAARNRCLVEKYRNGGAHKMVVSGNFDL